MEIKVTWDDGIYISNVEFPPMFCEDKDYWKALHKMERHIINFHKELQKEPDSRYHNHALKMKRELEQVFNMEV